MTAREFKYIRRKRFKVVTDEDHVFSFKTIRCPICSQKITATVNGWQLDKWGWAPTNVEIECTTNPGFESEDFDEWMHHHYVQPYSDWLPLQNRIERLMFKKVRFTKLKI